MRRQVLLALAVVCLPAVARANVINLSSLPPMLPAPNQTITVTMTGSDPYNASDMLILINNGAFDAPRITHVFGDPAAAIPTANLAGSIWGGGLAGIFADPDGTFPGGPLTSPGGLRTGASFAAVGFGFTEQTTNGIYVTLTFDATGVLPGTYPISFTDHPNGPTTIYSVLSPPVPAPLEIINGVLTVIPEPASVVMGLFALAGLAAVAVRRHRARRMAVCGRASGAV